jgi:tetratricopeptide (TPR) repeat protein
VPDAATEYAAALRAVGPVLEAFPRSAEGHELRGDILLGLHRVVGGDSLLTAAIGELEIATGDPTRVTSWTRLSQAYQIAGRYPESLFAIEQASRVDAYQVNRKNLLRRRFETALLAERFAAADTACRTGLREWPGDPRFSACQVELWGRSRSDGTSAARALAVADSLAHGERSAMNTALWYLWAAAVLARAGRGDSADRVAARALATPAAQAQPDLLVEAAALRLLRRDPDSALALIAVAVRREPQARPYLASAPWFRPLRPDPRFPAALQGISPREAGRPRS